MTGYLAVGLLGVSLGAIVTPLTTTDPAPHAKPYVKKYPAAIDDSPTLNIAAREAHTVALVERQAEVEAAAERKEAAEKAEQERQARVEADRLAQVAADKAKQKEATRVAQAAASKPPPTQKATPAARQFSAPAPAAQGQRFEATAYTAFCDTGCIGVTATGLDVSNTIYTPRGHRVIAVDPGVVPLGTVVTVKLSNGVSFSAEAADTGGRIVGSRIDILTASHAEAVRFGRQAVTIIR